MKVESPDTLWSAPGPYFNAKIHNNSRPKPDLYYSKSDKCGFHMLLYDKEQKGPTCLSLELTCLLVIVGRATGPLRTGPGGWRGSAESSSWFG